MAAHCVTVKLVREDGNVFAIIGKACGALKRAGMLDEAKAFSEAALARSSYDAGLRLAMLRTVEVT